MQLTDDDPLSPVDDEGAILAHQGNVAKENLLLLHIAQAFHASLGVLVINLEPDSHLERSRVGHAAFFALGLVILKLKPHGISALGAEVRRVFVIGTAEVTQHIARMKWVGDHHVAAVRTGGPQMIQALEITALALPVADGKINKLELRNVAEVSNRKHRRKDGLKAIIFALLGQLIHLQKALVAAALHFDQIRYLNRGRNLREVETAAKRTCFAGLVPVMVLFRHALS